MQPRVRTADTHIPEDVRDVLDAAALLGIREFDLFRAAFRRWHGREPETKPLERHFVAYMFHRRVPPWVRHFAREALRLEREGRLDPAALGIAPAARRPVPPLPGPLYVALTGVAALVLYLVILGAYDPGSSAPLSCRGGGPGLQFLEEIARGFAGDTGTIDCPPPR